MKILSDKFQGLQNDTYSGMTFKTCAFTASATKPEADFFQYGAVSRECCVVKRSSKGVYLWFPGSTESIQDAYMESKYWRPGEEIKRSY